MYRLLHAVFLIVILSGCATTHLQPDGVSEKSLTATNGVLVGSFSRAPGSPSYYSQTFYFKSLATGELHQIKSQPVFNMLTGKTPDDFETSESSGAVFSFSLPAGRYSFVNFRLYNGGTGFEQNWSSKEAYSIPFEVRPNAINYVGEIRLEPIKGRNFFGMAVPAGGVWIISDQRGRDLPILKKIRPGLPQDSVVSVIPTSKEIFTPLVVLPPEFDEYKKGSASKR